MSLSDRRRVLSLLAALPLAACGFRPVYGPGGSGEAVRGRIRMADPTTRQGFDLVARLEDRIGSADAAVYRLDYSITTGERAQAIDGADNINRVNATGTVAFTVTEIATGQVVLTDSVETFTAFATTGSPVTNEAARRDAEERLMIALADQIVSRLLSAAGGWS